MSAVEAEGVALARITATPDDAPVSTEPPTEATRPLLIFGGTFDPPQLAHTRVAVEVARMLGADLIVIPTAANPLKDAAPTAAEHRHAMTMIAFDAVASTDVAVEVSTIELDRPPPSYTVDTIAVLRERSAPARALRLLLGSDAALEFARWRTPERILAMATPAVILRPPHDRAAFEAALTARHGAAAAARWLAWVVDGPRMDIAATDVRRRLARGEKTTGLLDPAVDAYIRTHGLYGSTRSAESP